MTVTPRHRAGRARILRARVAAVAVVLATLLPASLASAAESPAPSPSPTPGGSVSLTLSPVGNGIVRPGEALAVSLTLSNERPSTTAPTNVTLSLGAGALPDRAALTAWLSSGVPSEGFAPLATTTLPAVDRGESSTTGVVIDSTDPALALRAPGVYPLVATGDGPAGALVSPSVLIVPDDARASTDVGVVVPITAGPLTTGLLSSTQIAELTGPEGALTDALDAVAGTSAILAVDPAIAASIRVLGTSAPTTAVAWLARLEALGNSRFALQFGDADIAAQLEGGLARPARPTSFTYAMTLADFPAQQPTAAPTPSASPTADPTAPVLPDLDTLLDIGTARDAVYWPADGTATTDVVATLGALGDDEDAALTLVPSTSTTAGSLGGTVPARAAAGESGLLVYDADVSAALATASAIDDSVLRGAELARAAAYLDFAIADAAGRPLLVSVGREVERSHVALGSTLLTVTDAPGAEPANLLSLAGASPLEVVIADQATEPARAEVASAFRDDEQKIAQLATVLDDPSLLTGPARASTLQLLGIGWMPDVAAWDAAVLAHRAATAATLDAVGLIPLPDVQQIGPSADLPVWVRNDLPYPVHVVLSATPDDLRLVIQRSTDVVASPQSNTRVLIPVTAQIGSGEVDVALQLRSRTFDAVGGPQTVHVTVRADWERYGIAALVTIVVALLAIGLIRTVRRRRRARIAAATDDARDADAASPGEDRE